MEQARRIGSPGEDPIVPEDRVITVALAGQPNAGKSTVFNVLTGLDQHVGNWPGKTVEKREGICRLNEKDLRIIDLPGTYALSAACAEERVARDFILRERPDVVVVIVDATALQRSLYLVAELLWLPAPVVLGLNMMDVAERHGVRIEPDVLQAALGIPVVPMVARRNQGIRELMSAVQDVVRGVRPCVPRRPAIRQDHRRELESLCRVLTGQVPAPYADEWVALKLLEGDEEITALAGEWLSSERWQAIETILAQHEDGVVAIASGRYEWIGRMVRAALVRPGAGQVTVTEKLDRVATHPVLGLLVLLGLLGSLFWVTYAIGTPLQRWLDASVVHAGAHQVRAALVGRPAWVTGVLVGGVIGGAGTALTLLPILVIFFAAFGVLEDTGYMTRGAYVVDRFMHPIGLHGKSFLPLCLRFGCNVPAVFGARTIGDGPQRLLTVLLAPLVPCSARMAVIIVLAPVFFPDHPAVVVWGLVTLNLAVLALMGRALRRFALGGKHLPFIMELPLYHVPHAGSIARSVWHRTLAFIRNAGIVILAGAVIVWTLSTLPAGRIESSYLAALGRTMAPAGALLGLDWRMMTALLSSFVAKENTIATLGVLYDVTGGDRTLDESIKGTLTPAAGLAMMVVQMLFIPCLATVAAMRAELRAWRWIVVEIVLLLVASFALGALVYRVALVLGLGA